MKKFFGRFKPAASRAWAFLKSAKARPAEKFVGRFAVRHLVASGLISAAIAAALDQWLR